jgi:hypothetical protein
MAEPILTKKLWQVSRELCGIGPKLNSIVEISEAREIGSSINGIVLRLDRIIMQLEKQLKKKSPNHYTGVKRRRRKPAFY